MNLFLIRHGEAEPESLEGLGDEARALTVAGRQLAFQHFQRLLPRLGTVDLCFTSPLVRCVQTATLFALATGYNQALRAHRSLLPDRPIQSLIHLINECAGQNAVLVGHNPNMGVLAATLIGASSLPAPVKPGTVVGLTQTADAQFILKWMESI